MSERAGAFNKDPDEIRKFSINWSPALDEGDTISASSWVFPTGIAAPLTPAASFDNTTTTVWINSGSTAGDYLLENTITTADGETMQGHLLIRVRA